MDYKLKEYLDSGKYLPEFIEDFHDQKTLFKRLDKIVGSRSDAYTKDINWTAAQVYTVDIFLWFMAKHGYTLQRSRKQVPFHNIHKDLNAFESAQSELKADMLKQIFSQHKKEE